MKKAFGNLSGIPVYKVCNFHPEIARQGFIQIIDDGDRYWKICTTSSIADGMYDSMTGNTSIYDQTEFNVNIGVLKRITDFKEDIKKPEPKKNLTEECVECLLPELDSIIEEIMGKAQGTCEELLSLTDVVVG